MQRETYRAVLATLQERYPVTDWTVGMDPFAVLISVIVSQNTTVANERRAIDELRRTVGLSPRALATAYVATIAKALRPAGLYRRKAPRIQAVAQAILDRYDGKLEDLLAMPAPDARAALMELPGVGPKTADVVLSMAGGVPTMPVDTHIWRIARRWEISTSRRYEDVREALERVTPSGERRRAHLTLIQFGRETCTARRPKCRICPVADPCPFFAKIRSGEVQIRLYEPP